MASRKLGLCLAGLLLAGVLGCNEIVGIHAATEDPDAATSCSPDYTVTAERAIGCLYRIACDPFFPPFSMSECVGLAWQDTAPAENCAFGADSCADVDACIGRRYEPASACGDSTGWSCDDSGDRAINCTEDGGYSVDCAMFGGTCVPHQSTVVPTAYACQPTSASSCPDGVEEGDYYCDGTMRFTCIDGEPYGVDCAAIASECIEFDDGEAYCSDRTESCSDPNSVECHGDVMAVCDVNGYKTSFDCSSEGLSCGQDSETASYECLADGCETISGCTEACLNDGKSLRFCTGGVAFSLDCTDYDYDGCIEGTIKGSVPIAYCARTHGATPHP